MTNRIRFDFSRHATIIQSVEGAATFTGVDELGRAQGSIGAGNAVVRVMAGALGDWAEGATFLLGPATSVGRVEIEDRGAAGLPNVRAWPAFGATAKQAAKFLSLQRPDPRVVFQPGMDQRRRAAMLSGGEFSFVTDNGAGDGSDPAPTGSTTLTGGQGTMDQNSVDLGADAGGAGLIFFDNEEAVVLQQFVALLDSSVAWTLDLVRRDRGYTVGGAIRVAGATGSSAYFATPLVLLPGWGLSFTAAVTGGIVATVKR